jgi:hypothetical protein
MRAIVYCWLLTIVVVSCVSSLIPTKPPTITFVTPTTEYATIQPVQGETVHGETEHPSQQYETTTDDYDEGYQQGYMDKEDE